MKKSTPLILIIVLGLLVSACAQATQAPPAPTQAPETAATQPVPTSMPEPSPAAPQPGKILLVTPQGIDPQPYQALLGELSAALGWLVENRAGLQPADLTPDIRAVVMLAPLANYAELVNAAPQVQFVIFSPLDLPAAANLTVIRQRAEYQAFVSGFISTLLSPDYRAAGLLPSDGMLGGLLQEAYVNGGRYYCGLCAPGWPLGLYFPAVAALPAASDGPTWQAAAADLFDNKKADVFFLTPDAALPEVTTYLQGKMQLDRTVILLGTQSPPDGFANQWAASVRFDDLAALRQVWPQVEAGQSGGVVESPLVIDYINDNLLSAGRMRLVDELLAEISAGRISPLTVAP